jgi:hypothetical protein
MRAEAATQHSQHLAAKMPQTQPQLNSPSPAHKCGCANTLWAISLGGEHTPKVIGIESCIVRA